MILVCTIWFSGISPGAGTPKKKFVQPADYLESELTEWWNEPSATTPGSMYEQIVVSVFLYNTFSNIGGVFRYVRQSAGQARKIAISLQ